MPLSLTAEGGAAAGKGAAAPDNCSGQSSLKGVSMLSLIDGFAIRQIIIDYRVIRIRNSAVTVNVRRRCKRAALKELLGIGAVKIVADDTKIVIIYNTVAVNVAVKNNGVESYLLIVVHHFDIAAGADI